MGVDLSASWNPWRWRESCAIRDSPCQNHIPRYKLYWDNVGIVLLALGQHLKHIHCFNNYSEQKSTEQCFWVVGYRDTLLTHVDIRAGNWWTTCHWGVHLNPPVWNAGFQAGSMLGQRLRRCPSIEPAWNLLSLVRCRSMCVSWIVSSTCTLSDQQKRSWLTAIKC